MENVINKKRNINVFQSINIVIDGHKISSCNGSQGSVRDVLLSIKVNWIWNTTERYGVKCSLMTLEG